MVLQPTDLFLIERGGTLYGSPVSDIPAPAEVGVFSNFASPNAGGYVPGRFYDNSFRSVASGVIAGAADRVEMSPFFTSKTLTIDQIGVSVSTAVAGSLLKCFIYGSGSEGWPSQLMYEGANGLSGANTAYVSHALNFSFDPGIQYWLGVRWNSTTTVRGVAQTSSVNLGLGSSAGTAYNSKIQRTIPFANALPQSWPFASSDLTTGVCPSIRFRAA